ncbi:MAG: ribulose-phosphate 3-epimerase [Lentisphaeria bacterium]|jgi:ribulose-phosphate 3-epimerase
MSDRTMRSLSVDQVQIAPSILAADFCRLGDSVTAIAEGGADVVHIDIMDGHFVPNLSMGPAIVKAIRPLTSLPFDVHLMLSSPGRYVAAFVDAGADHITIHVESEGDLAAILREIHDAGCTAGITLRPGTPAISLAPYLPLVEMVLVMTVEPGFGGQSFMAAQLAKVREIKAMIQAIGRPIHLEVDGGIGAGNAGAVVAAGANVLVAGSSVYNAKGGAAAGISAIRAAVQG